MSYNIVILQTIGDFMGTEVLEDNRYTPEMIEKIKTHLDAHPEFVSGLDLEKKNPIELLDELSKLVEKRDQQGQVEKQGQKLTPDEINRMHELEFIIDTKIVLPIQEKKERDKPKVEALQREYKSYFTTFMSFILELIELIGLNKKPEPLPVLETLDDPKINTQLSLFAFSRDNMYTQEEYQKSLSNAITEKLGKDEKSAKLTKRINALQYSGSWRHFGNKFRYDPEDNKLSVMDGFMMKDVDISDPSTHHYQLLEKEVEDAEAIQRKHIATKFLKKFQPNFGEELSDIHHDAETLKHLESGYTISKDGDIEFKTSMGEEEEFLQKVVAAHNERQAKLDSETSSDLEKCELKNQVPDLETAVRFADPSQQRKFVEIMKGDISASEKTKKLQEYVEKDFDQAFLQTASQAYDGLSKTDGFEEAFKSASGKEKRRLVSLFQLRDSLKQKCSMNPGEVEKSIYSSKDLEQSQIKEIEDEFNTLIGTEDYTKEGLEELNRNFEEMINGLSLEELEEFQKTIEDTEDLGLAGINDAYQKAIVAHICEEKDFLTRAKDWQESGRDLQNFKAAFSSKPDLTKVKRWPKSEKGLQALNAIREMRKNLGIRAEAVNKYRAEKTKAVRHEPSNLPDQIANRFIEKCKKTERGDAPGQGFALPENRTHLAQKKLKVLEARAEEATNLARQQQSEVGKRSLPLSQPNGNPKQRLRQ